ncbi:ABC transporter permease [Brachybacterium sp. GCM10030268]|uniref:ABC transporter permease n=1 Tax=Brachybacterium sp. GCM10030268 TaxID=3273382 RepID=UPI00360F5B78
MNATDAHVPAAIPARSPGLRSLLVLVRCEIRMVVRDTAGLLVPLGLPLLILLTSAGSAGEQEIVRGRTALDLFVLPLIIVMVLTMVGVLNMPSFLATYRRTGVLRRLRVTPASPLMVMLAQVITSILQSALGIGLAGALAVALFGANPPVDVLPALGVLALAAAALYATGMIVAAVAPTPNSAVAIGLVAFLLLGASGGMFGGPEALPEPVAELGSHLPFGAAVEGLSAAWAGEPVAGTSVLSLTLTLVLGVGISAWLFRWD